MNLHSKVVLSFLRRSVNFLEQGNEPLLVKPSAVDNLSGFRAVIGGSHGARSWKFVISSRQGIVSHSKKGKKVDSATCNNYLGIEGSGIK